MRKTGRICIMRLCNCIGLTYVFGLTFALLYVDCFIICPKYYDYNNHDDSNNEVYTSQRRIDDDKKFGNVVPPPMLLLNSEQRNSNNCSLPFYIGCFIVCQLLLNFALFHYASKWNKVGSLFNGTTKSYSNVVVNEKEPLICSNEAYNRECNLSGSGKFCHKCQLMVPLRSYHCPVCDYCILKKDHHCFMTGGCVGHGNHRYFIVFVFWILVGCVYGASYLIRYLNRHFAPIYSRSFFYYVGPVAVTKFLASSDVDENGTKINSFDLSIILLLNLICTATCASFSFLIAQCFFLYDDQTMFERMKFGLESRHNKNNALDYNYYCNNNQDVHAAVNNSGKWFTIQLLAFRKCRNTLQQRFQMLFGPYCLLNFFMPMPIRNKLDPSFRCFIDEYQLKSV